MTKTRLAACCAIACLPTLAAAQSTAPSTVQVSGIVDAALHVDTGTVSGTVKSLASGQRDASRITFSGVEDLGSGLRASFVLESGFTLDNGAGANNPPGVAAGAFSWGRLAAVSLGSDNTGYLSLGRQYTPMWAISAGPANDPFGAGWLGGITSIYSFAVRASNSVVYSYGYTAQTTLLPAPRKGLGVMLMYAFGEATAPAPSTSGQQLGGNVSYGDGVWWLGYGRHQIRGNSAATSATAAVTNTPKLTLQTLGASYQFDFGRVHVGYNTGKTDTSGPGAVNRNSWHVGANVPFAERQYVRFIYGQSNDRTAANADRSTFQIGYGYDLSKRTALYAAVGQLDNDNASALGLAGATAAYAPGSTARAYTVGVRHLF